MKFSLATLEFYGVLALVGGMAGTPMGARRVTEIAPLNDRLELDRRLAAIAELTFLLEQRDASWSFSGLEDPEEWVGVLRIRNAALDGTSLLELARICTQAMMARSAISSAREEVPVLWEIVEGIAPELTAVTDEITRKILPGGELDDSASSELARLRREINAQRARLTRSLEAAMRSAGTAIQDEIVTMRNDRFVIPVKTDFRGQVTGVAHGFSSSGATVYIEPLGAIEANNELQNLRGQAEREASRILFALTDRMRDLLYAVEHAVEAVAELDAVRAKVEFARKFKAVVPEITDSALELVDARHPVLEDNLRQLADPDRSIVPSSFGLTAENSVVIISGANAGGKTVVLKTAGLLSLMAIAGLPVPASRARVPFYRSVLADIGDHQSLGANLSTFSSHMSNIASMIRECSMPSLVLLDEAGTGTDPEEGSALGVAIVDHFRRECGAHVIASTHYRGLKMYAANDPSVINASVEFDERTLQPTYRLMLGLAGASSGIEIASRFGIDSQVIEAARQNLDVSAQEAEAYLQRLQTETRQAEDLRIALEEEREAVAMKYAGLEVEAVKKEKVRQKEFEGQLAQTIDNFERQSKAFLKTIEDKALRNRLDKERLARKAELNRAVMSKVNQTGPKASRSPVFGGLQSRHADQNADHGQAGTLAVQSFAVGSKVITSFGNVGTIERMDKEVAEVLVGGMRLREKLSDLQLAEETKAETPAVGSARGTAAGLTRDIDGADISAELNLIGKTTADAEYELDRFLDEAYMASLPRVRIIHGFGTGALKNYVHHFLKGHAHVQKYAFAPPNQGGNGATIADLKT